jgi:hypothetical protein
VVAGLALFAVVSLALMVAAIALGARLYGDSTRGEQAFASGVLLLLGIYLPVHALGWSSQLTTRKLAATTLVLCALVLAGSLLRVPAPHRFLRDAVVRVVLTPAVALRLCWRERSIAVVSLALTLGILLWTAFLSYLAPASGWDGLWYHDAIVGFSIQNHGFAVEPSLPNWHSLINGYARGSEYFNMWPVLLWDRRLLELAPSVFAAIALPGLEALFARFGVRPVLRIGLACAFVLIPALSLQLRSTYIDAQVAVLYLAALYFSTRPTLRLRDAVLATLSIGMLCNAKSSGLPISILMLGLFGFRVLLRWGRPAPLRMLLGLTSALIVVALLGGNMYLRNYLLYKNPLWPLEVESKRLDIHWHGPAPVTMPNDRDEFLEHLVTPPTCGHEWPDTRSNGYGNGPPFIVLPGALLALLILLFKWARTYYRRVWPEPDLANITYIALITFAMLPISPTWTWARFNLHIVLGVFALFAWLLGHEKRGQLGEGALAGLLCVSLMTVLWSHPAWGVPPKQALELLKQTPNERSATQLVDFMIPKEIALLRNKELRRGDTLLADYAIDFMSMAWNERISNRLQLINVDHEPSYTETLARVKPKWTVVRPFTGMGKLIAADTKNWQLIGTFRGEFSAYRRVRRAER